ncbi:MAG: hypothetical protein NTV30_05500, partial [Chloroflexi bacterium]|nr:hypothetical protein [Chloroflexota bacterium]
MSNISKRLKDLKERENKEKELGGPDQIKKNKEKGKLTARERLDQLFDSGSFHELDMFVRHRCVDFEMQNNFVAGDGVVTGPILPSPILR